MQQDLLVVYNEALAEATRHRSKTLEDFEKSEQQLLDAEINLKAASEYTRRTRFDYETIEKQYNALSDRCSNSENVPFFIHEQLAEISKKMIATKKKLDDAEAQEDHRKKDHDEAEREKQSRQSENEAVAKKIVEINQEIRRVNENLRRKAG